MLVLTRKPDQSIMAGGEIEITILEVRGEQVRWVGHNPHFLSELCESQAGEAGSDFRSSPRHAPRVGIGPLGEEDLPFRAFNQDCRPGENDEIASYPLSQGPEV